MLGGLYLGSQYLGNSFLEDATALTLSLSESINTSDSLSHVFSVERLFTDSLVLTELFSKINQKNFSDSIGLNMYDFAGYWVDGYGVRGSLLYYIN